MGAIIKTFEELSLNAHPAFHTTHYDGWLLRYAGGYTNRANSVNVLYPSNLPISDKVDYCEHFYAQLHLPAVFKITPLSLELDAILEERAYRIVTPTHLMTAAITPTSAKGLASIIESGICETWQDNYFRINQMSDTMIPLAKKVQNNIVGQSLCATITHNREVVACGLCVVERGYAGLFDIIVAPQHRQKGYGQDICYSLLCAASQHGAKTAYLQVVADNSNAIHLYEKIGFKNSYQYWYRVKEQ